MQVLALLGIGAFKNPYYAKFTRPPRIKHLVTTLMNKHLVTTLIIKHLVTTLIIKHPVMTLMITTLMLARCIVHQSIDFTPSLI